ncbi:uncharacterized protein LOC107047934 [Diachasma alloeum]|uniref:uncharacterized protein LOC107047934 n=1 Tax=Diachasma alloeum TaxID=454923 RepID=UPI000738276A|nr:uncharacterized protein LOC107047934 [Diachasma alloeum]
MIKLQNALKGGPYEMISNLQVSAVNFEIAWNKLKAHYDNPRLIIYTHIDRILDLKRINEKSSKGLSTLVNTVTQSLDALKPLGAPIEHWDIIVSRVIRRIIYLDTKKAWEVHMGSERNPRPLREFLHFLEARARALENVEREDPAKPSKISTLQKSKVKQSSARVYQTSAVTAPSNNEESSESSTSGPFCRLCDGSHWLGSKCERFMAKSAAERRDFISKRSLCSNCFGPHRVDNCKSSITCQKWKGKHHTSIHEGSSEHPRKIERPQDRPPAPAAQDNQGDPGRSHSGLHRHHHQHRGQLRVQLATSSHQEHHHQGQRQRGCPLTARSSISLHRHHQTGCAIGNCQKTDASASGSHHMLCLLIDQGSEVTFITEQLVQVLRLRRSSSHIRVFGIGGLESRSTRGALKVTLHSRFDLQHQVEITAHIIGNEINKSPDNQLVAQQTIFGWIVSGTVCCTDCKPKSFLTAVRESPTEQLLDLKKFWVQEELRSTEAVHLNPEDQECELHFQGTHTRNSEERFVVRPPLKTSPSALGDSRRTALQLLHRTAKKLETNLEYGKLCKDFIKESEDLGHMRRVSESSEPSPVHYLPHHGLLREDSITTKRRVVFNGYSKTTSGVSLNEILHAERKLQTEGSDVLIWLRTHRLIIGTDIVKMFRQIKVRPEDWDLQRILCKDEEGNIITYQLTTVTYGQTCVPWLASWLVEDEGHRFPLAAVSLTKGRYVDDIYGAAESEKQLKDLISQLINLCMAGGLPLQKWISNHQGVLQELQLSTKSMSAVQFEDTIVKSSSDKITNRTNLSEIAQINDPLGLIGPVIITAKIFIQELWLLKIG